jgi:hypothetical protein
MPKKSKYSQNHSASSNSRGHKKQQQCKAPPLKCQYCHNPGHTARHCAALEQFAHTKGHHEEYCKARSNNSSDDALIRIASGIVACAGCIIL